MSTPTQTLQGPTICESDSKLGSHVNAHGATHAKGFDKVYHSHKEVFQEEH